MAPKLLSQISGMPQMSAAFAGWEVPIKLVAITQVVDADYLVTEEETVTTTFKGVIQPLKAEEIALKPDGERSWQWYMVHVRGASPVLRPNDRITYAGQRYKIMERKNYALDNYIEYHAIFDYQDTPQA